MICYLEKIENNHGRIFVKDLEATTATKLRQLDLKLIEWIIVKNVKYVMRKGAVK